MFKKGDFVEHRWMGNGVYQHESRWEGDAYVQLEDGQEVLVSESNLKHRKPTFKEWFEKHPPRCRCCNELLDWGYDAFYTGRVKKIIDVDGSKVKGMYCSDCYHKSKHDLQSERFVELYKGNPIYTKEGKFFPYWECPYKLSSLEECRQFIEQRIVQVEGFKKYFEGLKRNEAYESN
jgi:hypothetical protein